VIRVALTCAGIDRLIAATSLQHDFTVVTRNTDSLERCGARCFNPSVGM
jgi:predicted nucleic acid-binding protein